MLRLLSHNHRVGRDKTVIRKMALYQQRRGSEVLSGSLD